MYPITSWKKITPECIPFSYLWNGFTDCAEIWYCGWILIKYVFYGNYGWDTSARACFFHVWEINGSILPKFGALIGTLTTLFTYVNGRGHLQLCTYNCASLLSTIARSQSFLAPKGAFWLIYGLSLLLRLKLISRLAAVVLPTDWMFVCAAAAEAARSRRASDSTDKACQMTEPESEPEQPAADTARPGSGLPPAPVSPGRTLPSPARPRRVLSRAGRRGGRTGRPRLADWQTQAGQALPGAAGRLSPGT